MNKYNVYGVIEGRFELNVWARSDQEAKEKAEKTITSRIKRTPGLRLPWGDSDLDVLAIIANEVRTDMVHHPNTGKEPDGVS